MRLRPHRQNLVVWSRSRAPADRYRTSRHTRVMRLRRRLRIAGLLALVGLTRLTCSTRVRALAVGVVLTVAGILLRHGPASIVLLPGLIILLTLPLMEGSPKADRLRRSKLEGELSVYSTPAQRLDLEATLDRYPDKLTRELRDILARQAMATNRTRVPGGGPY
jgi:hypothetical protein